MKMLLMYLENHCRDVPFHKQIMNGFNGYIDFLLSKKVIYEQVMMSIEFKEKLMTKITK